MTRLGFAVVAILLAGASQGSVQAAAKAKSAKASGKVPLASADEINKLKGDFKWGMSVDEVSAKVVERIEAGYADRLQKAANDPTRQDRVRKEMRGDVEQVKGHYVKFEGQKSGYDVSIIDQEFTQNTSESLLVAKEESTTRYFFFAHDKLYKMFIAFDKDMLQGKRFVEFGALMQTRFGMAREIFAEEKSKAGVKKKLDHFMWTSKAGDVLRLVDRSEFYDVYCLAIYDGQVDAQLADARKANYKGGPRMDPVVEAVTGAPVNDRDANDNVIDRITKRTIRRPGDDQGSQNIVVPSPGSEGGQGNKAAKPQGDRPAKAKGLEL